MFQTFFYDDGPVCGSCDSLAGSQDYCGKISELLFCVGTDVIGIMEHWKKKFRV
jgi:hypothetical protein